MQESLHLYMKPGLVHFMAFPQAGSGEGDILDSIRMLALDTFFDAIVISWIKDDETRKATKQILDSSHLTVVYGAHPRLIPTGFNLNDLTDEENRQKALATMKEAIDEAYEMDAVSCVYLSGKYPPDRVEEALEKLIESTRELCVYAQSKGSLKVLAEVFDHTIDKKSLIGPADLAKRYADAIAKDFDNFGLVVDLSHTPLIGETPEEAILPVKEYLVAVDLGNCVLKDPSAPLYGDKHPRFGFPGGENDVEEVVGFMKVLLDIGFLNQEDPPIVSFEVKPLPGEDPELVIANAKRTLNRAWALL